MPDTTIAIAIMLGSFVLLLMARMPIFSRWASPLF